MSLLEDLLNISISKNEIQMTNLKEFKSAVKTYGFSLNNFYDVKFEINASSPLFRALVKKFEGEFSSDISDVTRLMQLYTDECTIPGLQMSTGEYRINNSPQLKYAYGSVFSESNFSFIMDANSTIKKVFDIWTAFMYGYAIDTRVSTNNPNSISHRMRTRYRDDYAIDIIIIKYEKPTSSKKNYSGKDIPFFKKDIIPDFKEDIQISGRLPEYSNFYKALPVHSTRMFKAFPSNISSVPLNSGSSALNKLSVSFEYESYTTSVLTGGSVYSGVMDPVNG